LPRKKKGRKKGDTGGYVPRMDVIYSLPGREKGIAWINSVSGEKEKTRGEKFSRSYTLPCLMGQRGRKRNLVLHAGWEREGQKKEVSIRRAIYSPVRSREGRVRYH